jgi:hypothetical protein
MKKHAMLKDYLEVLYKEMSILIYLSDIDE